MGRLPSVTIVCKLISSERIRGIVVRRSTVIVALRYKVLAYKVGNHQSATSAAMDVKGKRKADSGFRLDKIGEWETAENEMGTPTTNHER